MLAPAGYVDASNRLLHGPQCGLGIACLTRFAPQVDVEMSGLYLEELVFLYL